MWRQRRNTCILCAALLTVAICLLAGGRFGQKKDGAVAVLQQHGKVIAELSLSKDTEMMVDDSNGGTNTILVKDGAVSVTWANCPDKICVHTGSISHMGDVIACLPHSLIITISGDSQNNVDAVAG